MSRSTSRAPVARVTLRAHQPAPARVEMVYKPLLGRALRLLLSLGVFWGAIPLLIWIPPHYPWVAASFVTGFYLAYRQWTGRFLIRAFAGICPRCGHPVSLGVDHCISLPHTLTCYHCHFEPSLEVDFAVDEESADCAELQHREPGCVGTWEPRWLADEAYMVCSRCHAGRLATPGARAAAEAENQRAEILLQLTREGKGIL